MRFKALVHVRLRGSVSDAAGNAVMNNVKRIAPNLEPHLLRIGKVIDFWFDAETEEIAREEMDLLSDRMLSNTVIEDWSYELEETLLVLFITALPAASDTDPLSLTCTSALNLIY